MREYQEKIIDAIISRKDWGGSNVVVVTINNVTKVSYYGHTIGVVDHSKRVAECDHCSFYNTSTTARINAVKMACNKFGYKVTEMYHGRSK